MKNRNPLLYTLGLFAAASLLSLATGPRGGNTITPEANAAGHLALPQLEGTWSGTWTDTLYAVGGAVTLVIWAEGTDFVASGTIDVTSISGALGVLSGGAIGLNNGVSLDIDFNCTDLGGGTVVLTPVKTAGAALSASASGSGNVSAPLDFGPFTLTGTASDTEIVGSFDFTSPGGGKGIAQFNKDSVGVEPISWGSAKAAYRQ